MNPIEIHIEELVLEGVAPGDRHEVAEAVAEELARLVAKQGLPAPAQPRRSLDRIDAGAVETTLRPRVGVLGAGIATAVHRGLTGRHAS